MKNWQELFILTAERKVTFCGFMREKNGQSKKKKQLKQYTIV